MTCHHGISGVCEKCYPFAEGQGMFNKYELNTIERALGQLIGKMRRSKYVGDTDPHLVKCEALQAKVVEQIKRQ